MAALSAVVFTMSWWLGLYLLARDPRKPVLVLAAIGLTSFASVVALDAVRVISGSDVLGSVEVYLVTVPGIAWFAVLLEMSRPRDTWRSRASELMLVAGVAAAALVGAALAGSVEGPLRPGHWLMFAGVSLSSLGAMLWAVFGPWQPRPVVGYVVVATLFFALGNAILVIPLGLVPSWLALASTGCDVALLGVAVAMWDAFDEGQALRADMLRSFAATAVVALLFGGQLLIGLAVSGQGAALTGLLVLRADVAAVHQPCHRDRHQRAGRPAGRAARSAGVLPLTGPAGRPRRLASHRGGAAAAIGEPACRRRRRQLHPAHPARAWPLRRPVQARRQPADRAADHRRAPRRPRRARPAAGAGQRTQGAAGRPDRQAQAA